MLLATLLIHLNCSQAISVILCLFIAQYLSLIMTTLEQISGIYNLHQVGAIAISFECVNKRISKKKSKMIFLSSHLAIFGKTFVKAYLYKFQKERVN